MLLALLVEELLFLFLSAFREDGGFSTFSFPFDEDGSGGIREGMLNDDISASLSDSSSPTVQSPLMRKVLTNLMQVSDTFMDVALLDRSSYRQ